MVFHFVKSTGDGACKCCDSCEGEYDVLCYYATTGNIKKRQYHGHGGFGIGLGERSSLFEHPLRISVGGNSVLVSGVVSLTVASRTHCGSAFDVQRGTGDRLFHQSQFFSGVNSPYHLNNQNGKYYFSGEDYRFQWRASQHSINGGDTFWVSCQWIWHNQNSRTSCFFVARVEFTGNEGRIRSSISSGSARSVGRESYVFYAENGLYEIADTPNTPFSSDEEIWSRVQELYPWFPPSPDSWIPHIQLNHPADGPNAHAISGHGGAYHQSFDFWRFVGFANGFFSYNSPTLLGLTGAFNETGILTDVFVPVRSGWSGPPYYPVAYATEDLGYYWQTTGDYNNGRFSRTPHRDGIIVSIRQGYLPNSNQSWEQAYAWDRDGIITGVIQPDRPNNFLDSRLVMFGPVCLTGDGEFICFSRSSENPSFGGSGRNWTTTESGVERMKCANGTLRMFFCDTKQIEHRRIGTSPFAPPVGGPQMALLKFFDNPFGTITVGGVTRGKVPYSMFESAGFLYALICDDNNPWYFRWLCKYRIGKLSLEMIWRREPEHEWQCFHSFCYRDGEVWVAVTASDQFVFSNPSQWIGFNDSGEPPIEP